MFSLISRYAQSVPLWMYLLEDVFDTFDASAHFIIDVAVEFH